jgi:hypothetical protein
MVTQICGVIGAYATRGIIAEDECKSQTISVAHWFEENLGARHGTRDRSSRRLESQGVTEVA